LGKKFDVTFHAGTCRYSETEMNYKLKVTINDQKILQDKKLSDWNKYYQLYGFRKEDFGKKFILQGNQYKIVGLNVKKPKFSLEGERVEDGKIFLFIAEDIAKKPLSK
jgi:hypothetical protein